MECHSSTCSIAKHGTVARLGPLPAQSYYEYASTDHMCCNVRLCDFNKFVFDAKHSTVLKELSLESCTIYTIIDQYLYATITLLIIHDLCD